MSKKKRKAKKKTKATDELQKHSGRAKAGKGSKGVSVSMALAVSASTAARPESKIPRPYRTRYPVKMAEYLQTKADAAAKKSRPVRRRPARGAESALDAVADRDRRKPTRRAAQAAPSLAPTAAPVQRRNFEGIRATGWLPPDCTMAAGPNHVLVSVNSTIAIHRKTGGRLNRRRLTDWFANLQNVRGSTIFDPKLLYDQHDGRYVLLAVAVNNATRRSWFLLSVSSTADPLGAWRNYALDAKRDGSTQTNNWADYPAIGVDAHSLYITANMFAFNGGFRYAKVRVVPKRGPYSGATVRWWDFVRLKNLDNTLAFTVQPCHTYGDPGREYLVNSLFPNGSELTLWTITSVRGTPSLWRRSVATGPYRMPPDAVQSGGGPRLDSGDVRSLHAVCRGGSVYTALTTGHNWGTGSNVAAIHWFQINGDSGTLNQEGIYGARGRHYFYPALTADSNGNLTMVFSRSSRREFASMRYTGRRVSDPPGRMQGSARIRAGLAHYEGLDGLGRNRWGDYNGVAADPDGRTVWMYAPYVSARDTWSTRVGSSRF